MLNSKTTFTPRAFDHLIRLPGILGAGRNPSTCYFQRGGNSKHSQGANWGQMFFFEYGLGFKGNEREANPRGSFLRTQSSTLDVPRQRDMCSTGLQMWCLHPARNLSWNLRLAQALQLLPGEGGGGFSWGQGKRPTYLFPETSPW